MKLTKEKNKSHCLIHIEGALTLYENKMLKDEFLKVIQSFSSVDLDLSLVDKCDLAALQVLFSLHKTMKEKGKSLSLIKVSPEVKESIEKAYLGGLKEIL